MIDVSEARRWAERFRVPTEPVFRDHVVSHAIAALEGASVRFFGGTALCRTYLPHSRLSEDIDLLADDPRQVHEDLAVRIPVRLRREYPGALLGDPVAAHDGYTAQLQVGVTESISIYVGRAGPNTRWFEFVPTEVRLRYGDLPPTVLLECPTLVTFAVMKLSAWYDRHAPRDLFDLAGLARLGTLADPAVEVMFRSMHSFSPGASEFARAPVATSAAWEPELGAQVGDLPSIGECLRIVRDALSASTAD